MDGFVKIKYFLSTVILLSNRYTLLSFLFTLLQDLILLTKFQVLPFFASFLEILYIFFMEVLSCFVS